MKIHITFHKFRKIAILIGAWLTAAVGVLLLLGGILYLLNLYTITH